MAGSARPCPVAPFVVSETASGDVSGRSWVTMPPVSRRLRRGRGWLVQAEPAPLLGHRQWASSQRASMTRYCGQRESHRLQQGTVGPMTFREATARAKQTCRSRASRSSDAGVAGMGATGVTWSW
jgi:hypothetical protein